MNLGFIKSKNTKKQIIKNLILCSGLILLTNPSMNACASTNTSNFDMRLGMGPGPSANAIDIGNIVVEEVVEGEYDGFIETIETLDGGILTIGYDSIYNSNTGYYIQQGRIFKNDKNGNLLWNNELNGSSAVYFKSVAELTDGSIIVVGYSAASDLGYEFKGGANDAFIIKYSKDGQQEWIKGFGGSRDDMFRSVLNCPDGGFVVVGHSDSPDAGFTHNANYDTLIIKYDKNGNQEFMKQISGWSRDWVEDVKRTSDGGLIIAGYSWSNDIGFDNKGAYDVMLVKYDKNYNQEWIRGFGGSARDYGNSVVETSDKGFVVAGNGNSTNAEYENSDGDYKKFLVKFDRYGNQEWVKGFNGTGVPYNLTKSNDGGIIFSDSSCVYKYDKDGNQVWTKYLETNIHRIVEISNKELLFYGQSGGFGPLIRVRYNIENDKYKDLADSIDRLIENQMNMFNSVTKASDGGFVAVGISTSKGLSGKGSNGDAIIVKYDKGGNQEWVNSFGGSAEDGFNSVVETSDGGFIAVGYSSSDDVDYDCDTDYTAIIVKYDRNGNQLWAKNWGNFWYNDMFSSIIETSGGDIIAVGQLVPGSSQNRGKVSRDGAIVKFDGAIVKFDKNGNLLWNKSFGGSDEDKFNSVIETQDGGFVAVGESSSTNAGFVNNSQDTSYWDAIIVKFDSNGNKEWVKNFGGSDDDSFNSVIETQDGGFVAVGYSFSEDVDYDCDTNYSAIIVKYDENGNRLWAKNWGKYYDRFLSIIETSDEGIVAVGQGISGDLGARSKYDINKVKYSFNSDMKNKGRIYGGMDAIIVKFDKSGNSLWNKNFGGSVENNFSSVVETQDGRFVVVGYSVSQDVGYSVSQDHELCNAIIVKYDENGNQEWNKTLSFDSVLDIDMFNDLRTQVNTVADNELRRILNARLDGVDVNLGRLEAKVASANLDVYIKSQNMLSLSLDTNSITFENYSGVEDMEMLGAVNISINSSLPYQLNAYLPSEIANSDKSETLPIDILNIKDASESDYKQFANTTDKIVLKDGCVKGNDKVHTIDLKLASNQAHKADVYKTVIKFEAEQK